MIKSLKGKWSKRVWKRNPPKQLLAIWEIAYDNLVLLHSITDLRQLEKIPGLRLHKLKGDRVKNKELFELVKLNIGSVLSEKMAMLITQN